MSYNMYTGFFSEWLRVRIGQDTKMVFVVIIFNDNRLVQKDAYSVTILVKKISPLFSARVFKHATLYL